MRSPRLFLLLLPPAWAAAVGSEPDDPNQHAARSPCEPGHYLTTDCYVGQAMGCCPCPRGSFLSHPNRELSCSLCTPCRKDEEMVSDCTPTRDRQCRCKTGEHYCDSEHCPESCRRCTSCPGATLQSCNATRDTVCVPAAPAEPGPAAGSLAVSALVVSVVALVIVFVIIVVVVVGAIAWWRRRGVPLPQWLCRFTQPASAEPGGHSHSLGSVQPVPILQTTDPERGPPDPDAETTRLLQEEASPPTPGAQTRPGPSADPDPDPEAGAELQVEVVGGGRAAPEPAPPTPAAAAPGALAWAEVAAGLHPREQVRGLGGPGGQ